MDAAAAFLHIGFVGFVALFPPVNPVGTALILEPFFRGATQSSRKQYSVKIALYCFAICSVALVAGSWIFKLFGISLPSVQVAGGILLCRMGWQLLSTESNGNGSDGSLAMPADPKGVEANLFYPFSFPMTTGAGTIAVLLTLSAHGHSEDAAEYVLNLSALLAAVGAMCLCIFFCYAYTPALVRRLGGQGALIVNRLSAFLVFCVGIQIGATGLIHLAKS